MSFRFEEKISLNKYNSILFLNFLNSMGLKILHKDRKVNSIYFDNINYSMFNQSEEGVRPRQKIRIRNYNNLKEFSLEKKISSDEGRYKITKRISDQEYKSSLDHGLLSDVYGVCYPVVIVNYTRSYYSLKNVRITYDFNINYTGFIQKNKSHIENKRVFEVKCQNLSDLTEICS